MSDTPLFEYVEDESEYHIKIRDPPEGESDHTLPSDYSKVASKVAGRLSRGRNIKVKKLRRLDSGSVLIRFNFTSDQRHLFYSTIYKNKSKSTIEQLTTRSILGVTGVTLSQRRELQDGFAAALLKRPIAYLSAIDISTKAYYLPSWIITVPFCLLTGVDLELLGIARRSNLSKNIQSKHVSERVGASRDFLARIIDERERNECSDDEETAAEELGEILKEAISHLEEFNAVPTAEITKTAVNEWLDGLEGHTYRLVEALARVAVGKRAIFKAVTIYEEPATHNQQFHTGTAAFASSSALIANSVAYTAVPFTQLGFGQMFSVMLGSSAYPTAVAVTNPVGMALGITGLAIAGVYNWARRTTAERSKKAREVLVIIWHLQRVYQEVDMLLKRARQTQQKQRLPAEKEFGLLAGEWKMFNPEGQKDKYQSKKKLEQVVYKFIRFYLGKVSETMNASIAGDG